MFHCRFAQIYHTSTNNRDGRSKNWKLHYLVDRLTRFRDFHGKSSLYEWWVCKCSLHCLAIARFAGCMLFATQFGIVVRRRRQQSLFVWASISGNAALWQSAVQRTSLSQWTARGSAWTPQITADHHLSPSPSLSFPSLPSLFPLPPLSSPPLRGRAPKSSYGVWAGPYPA